MKVVDTIKTTYLELFTVTLLHPAFEATYTFKDPLTNTDKTITASSIFNSLSIEPDSATKKLLRKHYISLRNNNNMVSCFIRTQLQQPYIPLPADSRIRILLKNKNDFLYHTKIIAAGSQQVYWFTNANNTMDDGIRHITKNASGVTDADLDNISTVNAEENCFGVIDIFNSVTDVNYRLLNGDILESPGFVIRFIKK